MMEDRAISLNAAIEAVRHAEVNFSVQSEIDFTKHKREVQEIIDNILDAQEKALRDLPPVTPKTGHWICGLSWKCSECGYEDDRALGTDFCPNCGCRMVEPQKNTKQGLNYADTDTMMPAT